MSCSKDLMSKVSVSLRPFSTQEVDQLCALLKERDLFFHHYFLFALHTGMRRNEILALTWHDVDLWKHREIVIPNPKRPRFRDHNARKIAIDETLLGILLDMRSPSRWVFQNLDAGCWGGCDAFFPRIE